jgi:galactonate dehydratase
MKVTGLTTLRLGQYPNLLFLAVHTDEGRTGLGETFFGARAVEAWLHETAAPYLLGQEALDIERHSAGLEPFIGFTGTGVETRGRSAVDIALWDLLGQRAGLPLYRLLGGLSRESVRIYNTCAGPGYVRGLPSSPDLPTDNWVNEEEPGGPASLSDLQAFLTDAGALAENLLAEGITAMKIWPFDPFAEGTGGHAISASELRQGLRPFQQVREAVGDRMELMVELHSKWDLPCAIKIAHALEDYQPSWFEDPLRMNCLDALGDFAASTTVPVAASETIATARAFRELIEGRGVRVVLFDPAWAGGISEARRIIALAAARQLPVAPHDCAGPVNFAAGVHLTVSAPNAFIQEGVRAFYRGWYRELVTDVPPVTDGHVRPLQGPGLGTTLRPEVWDRPDAETQVSRWPG